MYDQNDDSLKNTVVQSQILVLFLHCLKNYISTIIKFMAWLCMYVCGFFFYPE